MDTKPSITYIKNGKEKTININIANKNIVLNSLFDIKKYNNIIYYKLKIDIEKIAFKNFTFTENDLRLYCNSGITQSAHL